MIGFHGKCHCGAIEVVFETSIPLAELETRSCACSFCARHGARTASDPNGRVTLHVKDASQLSRYRWGLATADFFVCRKCGVFVAAVLDDAFSTLNVNILEKVPEMTRPVQPVSYDNEDAASRIKRRRARWTPTRVVP